MPYWSRALLASLMTGSLSMLTHSQPKLSCPLAPPPCPFAGLPQSSTEIAPTHLPHLLGSIRGPNLLPLKGTSHHQPGSHSSEASHRGHRAFSWEGGGHLDLGGTGLESSSLLVQSLTELPTLFLRLPYCCAPLPKLKKNRRWSD